MVIPFFPRWWGVVPMEWWEQTWVVGGIHHNPKLQRMYIYIYLRILNPFQDSSHHQDDMKHSKLNLHLLLEYHGGATPMTWHFYLKVCSSHIAWPLRSFGRVCCLLSQPTEPKNIITAQLLHGFSFWGFVFVQEKTMFFPGISGLGRALPKGFCSFQVVSLTIKWIFGSDPGVTFATWIWVFVAILKSQTPYHYGWSTYPPGNVPPWEIRVYIIRPC